MKSKIETLVTITGFTPTYRVELIREKSQKVVVELDLIGIVGDRLADKALERFNESGKAPAIKALIVHQATGAVVAESGNPPLFKPTKKKFVAKIPKVIVPKKKKKRVKVEKELTAAQKKTLISQQKKMRREK